MSETYKRRHHNGKNITTTGLNATQITTAKKQHAKDLNIDDRIKLFKNQLKNDYVYWIPLRYFSDIGKINFPAKIDYRIKLFLETNMDRLFESRKVLASNASVLASNTSVPDVDAQIIFTRAPFVQYEQILLDKNFKQHLETITVSKKILRMGAQKTLIQNFYEIQKGLDSLNVELLGANRQFDWIETSIVPDKSNKHKTIYDSYNREMSAQLIKSLKLSNFTELTAWQTKKNIVLTI